MEDIYRKLLQLADQKHEIFDEDLHALMGTNGGEANGKISFEGISVSTAGESNATATVTLKMEGEKVTDAACGNGPVDAVFKAIDRVVGKPIYLEDYTLKSVSRGSEALGDATVKLRYGDNSLVVGRGISTDIIEASAKAYVNALSKIKSM